MKKETWAIFISAMLFNSSNVCNICSVTVPSQVLGSCFVVIVEMHNKVAGILDVTEGVRILSNNNNNNSKASTYNNTNEFLPMAPSHIFQRNREAHTQHLKEF